MTALAPYYPGIKTIAHDLDIILDTVCYVADVPRTSVISSRKRTKIVDARRAYCYIARKHTRYSFAEIGGIINRDHSTIVYAVKAAEGLLDFNDKIMIDLVKKVKKHLKSISFFKPKPNYDSLPFSSADARKMAQAIQTIERIADKTGRTAIISFEEGRLMTK